MKILEQTFQQFWMYQGGTTVPNPFIRYYQQLQLTAQECLMLSWWLQHSTSEYFPLNVDEVCEVFPLVKIHYSKSFSIYWIDKWYL